VVQETVKARVDRRLAAILAADVFGYSRLMGADEEGTLAQLKTHRRQLIDPKIKQHHGRIVKTTGDGMLVEFASPIEAVRCAIEVQRGMVTRNNDIRADKRIIFRVGINLGDVIAEKGDLFGEGVNIAARLEALSEPGGIAISRTVRDQIRDRLPIVFVDAGEHEVKNIARPVRVYALSAGAVGKLDAESLSEAPQRRPSWLHVAVFVVAVASAGLAWFVYNHLPAPSSVGATTVQGPTVAVLPFDNLTGDPAQATFADGLSEELISDLSRFQELRVLARNTTFTYKGKAVDVSEVGRKLNANYVIEGSVRHVGNQIKATAQLIDVADGNHVWSENYERDATATDLAIQDEVAGRISGSVGTWFGAIARTELERSRGKPVTDLTAYECMVGAAAAARLQEASEPMRRARACLESLVQHEPNYADAWSMLALVRYVQRPFGAGLDPPESEDLDKRAYLVDLTMQAASRAVQLAPQNAFARASLARAYFLACQGDQLRVEAEKAIALNPNDATTLGSLGSLLGFTGQWDLGVAMTKKAITLRGADTPNWYWRVLFNDDWFHGRYQQALDSAQKALVEQSWLDQMNMAYALSSLGRIDEAKAHVATLLKLKPDLNIRQVMAYQKMWCIEPAYREKQANALRQAGLPE
jgi:adenylate cyclase